MAKLTLIEMTQNILSALDSDPVDSIDETVEAVQVAELIKEAYFELLSQRDWPFLFTLGNLTALGDVNNPTKMKIPDTWNKVQWIKYDKVEVEYLPPEQFKHVIDNRLALTNVVNSSGYIINANPMFWTSYDDTFIFFDSINLATESTLQASKTTIYGTVQASWTHSDIFIPNIPEKFFPLLLAESKSQAFVNLKQQSNAREERKATRGRMAMRNDSWRNENGQAKYNTKVNYGRK